MSDCNQAEPGETGGDRGSLKLVFDSEPRLPIKSYILAAAPKSACGRHWAHRPQAWWVRKRDADAHFAFRHELTFTSKEA